MRALLTGRRRISLLGLLVLLAVIAVAASVALYTASLRGTVHDLQSTLYTRCQERAASVRANKANLEGDLATLHALRALARGQEHDLTAASTPANRVLFGRLVSNYADLARVLDLNIARKQRAITSTVPPNCAELRAIAAGH